MRKRYSFISISESEATKNRMARKQYSLPHNDKGLFIANLSMSICLIIFGLPLLLLSIHIFSTEVFGDVRISNMNNLSLGTWSGSGDVQDEDGVCVYNDSGSSYLITASGTGPGGSFHLVSGSHLVEYQVRFRGSTGSFVSLSANNSQNFSSADQVDSNCGGGTNATLRVTVSEAALISANRGSYSGTLSLQVEPN